MRQQDEITYYMLQKSPMGDIAIIWKNLKKPKVMKIELSGRLYATFMKQYEPNIKQKKVPPIVEFGKTIQQYLNGKFVQFSLAILDFSPYTEFQTKVWKETFRIPYGGLSTYKELAKKVGQPKSARAVGMCMANNPFPIVIPCHRVIKEGKKGDCLFQGDKIIGSYYSGVWIKEKLLEMEGAIDIFPFSIVGC